ncbi:MAG: hypothetical protein EOM20_06760 [Spartobacteria bacterium]|nr:hypothetical protein [Spartobacteria bacterium]
MAEWVVITADHLADYLVGAQLSALRTAALATGQVDPFENVMHDRCNYVRNRIAERISISASSYAVPPELKTCACWLIIEAMQTRIPGLNLDEDQRDMIRRAYQDLDIAGTPKLRISVPADPTDPPVQAGGGISLVSYNKPVATRETLQGF